MQRQELMLEPMLTNTYSKQEMIRIQQRMASIGVMTEALKTEMNNQDIVIADLDYTTEETSEAMRKGRLEIMKKVMSTEDENVRLGWMLGILIFALLILVLIIFRL